MSIIKGKETRTLDDIDVQIIRLLKENARMTLKDMSQIVHLTTPALSARMDKLESSGFIKGYHAEIDLARIGYTIKSFILISVLPEDRDKFYQFIDSKDFVLECNHITGPFSMLLKVVTPTTDDLDQFVGELQEFGRTETQVVFSTVLERH